MIDLSGLKVLSPLQKESERNSKMVILPREGKFSHLSEQSIFLKIDKFIFKRKNL